MGSSEQDLQDSKKIKNRQFIRVACGIMALAIFAYGYDFVADALNPPPASSKPPCLPIIMAVRLLIKSAA